MAEQTLTTKLAKLDESIDLRNGGNIMPHLAYLPARTAEERAAAANNEALLEKMVLPHIKAMQSVKAEDSNHRRFADRIVVDMFRGVPVMAEKSIQAFGAAVASMYAKVWHYGSHNILLRAMLSMWTGRTVTQTFGNAILNAINGMTQWLQSGYWGDNIKRFANRFMLGWGTDKPSEPPADSAPSGSERATMGGE